jgi:hypothetical protein
MTIATLILTCTIFVALGWTGDVYAPIALSVGAMVCIARPTPARRRRISRRASWSARRRATSRRA